MPIRANAVNWHLTLVVARSRPHRPGMQVWLKPDGWLLNSSASRFDVGVSPNTGATINAVLKSGGRAP